MIVLEKINPLWSLFDFHSSVSCLEVWLFFHNTLTEDFQFIGSQGSLKRDVMAQVSCPQWYPAACQSVKKMFQRGRERTAQTLHFQSGTLQLNSDDTASDGNVLFYSVSNADEE